MVERYLACYKNCVTFCCNTKEIDILFDFSFFFSHLCCYFILLLFFYKEVKNIYAH